MRVLAFTSPSTASFTNEVPGSVTITSVGGASDVALAATAPATLVGLHFHDNGDGTATLSGTPTSRAKTYAVKLSATSGGVTVVQTLRVTISW